MSDLRRLLSIAGPIVVVQVGLMTMGVADTIMVGRLSPVALAAVALGNLVYMTFAVVGMGVLMALDALVAQAIGADDRPAVARAFQRAVVLAGVITVPTVGLLCLSGPLFRLTGQPDELIAPAWDYVRTALPGLLAFFAFVVLRQTLQAMHRIAPMVWTILAANLLNVFLNWVFIYGNLGSPALGVTGAAVATTIGRYAQVAMLLALSWGIFRPLLAPFDREAFAPRPLLRFLALGAPIGLQFLLEVGVFALVGLLMGRLGTTQLAGHQIALNVASLSFMVPLGVSMAAAVLVGRAVGAHDPPAMRHAAGTSLGVAVSFMALSALTLVVFARPIAALYSPDPGVQEMAVTLLRMAALFQVFDGTQVTGIGILRGVGDTRAPLVANLVGYWALGLPLSLFLAFRLGLGAPGLWWGFVLGLVVVAGWMLLRVRVQMRRTQQRIVLEDEPAATPG